MDTDTSAVRVLHTLPGWYWPDSGCQDGALNRPFSSDDEDVSDVVIEVLNALEDAE